MRSYILLVVSLAMITGCAKATLPVTAKNLLTSSSKVVSFSIDDNTSISTIDAAMADGAPTRVEMSCPAKLAKCQILENKFNEKKIPVKQVFDDKNKISLIYLTTSARNCPPQVFGCSVAANTLQMVPNYKQITNPDISDPASAASGVEAYNNSTK